MSIRPVLAWLLFAVGTFFSVHAHGGVVRPNMLPLGVSIGGAGFAGVSDPTTIYYNPAGLILNPKTELMLGSEMLIISLGYEPIQGNDEAYSGLAPILSFASSTRFARRGGRDPLPLAVGLGFYNTVGITAEFDEDVVRPGILSRSILLFELVPAVAYEVTSTLAVGIALRVGFMLFDETNNEREGTDRVPFELSGFATNVGVAIGAAWAPLGWLRVGVVYSSPMKIRLDGDAKLQVQTDEETLDRFQMEMPIPQWAAFGICVSPSPFLKFFSGVRWYDWSSFHELIARMSVPARLFVQDA